MRELFDARLNVGDKPMSQSDLAEAAKTVPILLVEQNLHVVRQLAAGAVVLSGGRVVHTGRALDFLDDAALIQRHLGVSTEPASLERPAGKPVQQGAAL